MRIGIDLGGSKITGIVLDALGRECARERIATPTGDYAATVAAVVSLVGMLETGAGTRCHVGVGTPGAVSKATGLMKNCNSTCLNGRPLHADLQRALAREIRIANDADCFALSEAHDGAAIGARTVFGVILGTGVGGGVVVEGRLVVGPNAIAGEWGHNPLPWPADDERPGPACYCGKHGCLETFLSGPGLARDHAAAGGEMLTAKALAARATAGDARCNAALERYEDRLARGLATVINLLDPEVIVLGGGLSQLSRLYESVPRRWGRYVFSDRVDTRLVPPRTPESSP